MSLQQCATFCIDTAQWSLVLPSSFSSCGVVTSSEQNSQKSWSWHTMSAFVCVDLASLHMLPLKHLWGLMLASGVYNRLLLVHTITCRCMVCYTTHRVSALILRGVCLMRPAEIYWMYGGGCGNIKPLAWDNFTSQLEPHERGNPLLGYYKRLISSDPNVRDAAVRGALACC